MSRNAAGTYTAPANSVNPAVEGTTIDEGDFNAFVDDIEAALTDSLDRTGKGKITAHIDFDEIASPGTPAANVGRLYGGDDSGLTTLYWKDSSGNVYNLLQGAASGLTYQFSTSTTTTSDPGNGVVRFNNATLSSVTEIAIDNLTAAGADVSAFIVTWDDVGTTDRGRIFIQKRTAPGTIAIFRVSGALVAESGWTRLAVTYITHAGTFSASDPIAVSYAAPGSQGPTGSTGTAGANGTDPGVRWLFATSTTMADPSSGNIRLNNATLSSVTAIAVSANSGETGNPSVLAWLQALDDSTTSALRGTLTIKKTSAPQNFAIYNITGASTDNTTWLQLAVTHVSSSGSFAAADALSVQFDRTGDAGSGTVTSITAGAGLSSSGVGATGGTINVSGTLTSIEPVNAQTGTSYTVLVGDHARLVTLSNTSSVAVTLPQATGSFGAGFYLDIANINIGVVTITPTTSTINGAASLVLSRFLSVRLVSDGTNWLALHGSSLRTQTTTVASASTTDIGATESQRISVTGTTTITSFGTVQNQLRFVTFAGALTLTHNATTLILPGSANITTAAGDAAAFSSDASGNWRCLSYQKADGTAVVGGAASGSPSAPQGRLTLTAAVPVLTSDVPTGTTVFYTPYVGRFVPLWNGTSWTMTDIGGELSQATTDTAKSPAACAANSNYDLFVWNDSGTLRCTRGPAWTSDTARGTGAGTTELTRVQGLLVNANDIRTNPSATNGPAAQRGTYVGTVRTNGSSQVEFRFGGSASGGSAALLSVWNAYNRRLLVAQVKDSTSSWTYASTTVRSSNNSANNRVSFLHGLQEDETTATFACGAYISTTQQARIGIGVNSTTTITGALSDIYASGAAIQVFMGASNSSKALGWNYFQALESVPSGSATYYASGYADGMHALRAEYWG